MAAKRKTTKKRVPIASPDRKAGSAKPIEGRCGAKLPGTKPPRYCKRYPLKGRTRCRRCGGASLRGVASPTFKTGERSSYLPKNLAAIADRLAESDTVTSLHEQIIEGRARQIELLSELNGKEQSVIFGRVVEAWRRFKTAQGDRNEDGVRTALKELDRLLDENLDTKPLWDEIFGVGEQVRKLTDTELRHRRDLEGMIPVELHLAHMDRLLSVIVRAFERRDVPRSVLEDIQTAYETGTGRGAPN